MEAITVNKALDLDAITENYLALCALVPLRPIRNEYEYDVAVAILDKLLDAGAANEEHPLGGLKKLYWQDVLEIYKLAK